MAGKFDIHISGGLDGYLWWNNSFTEDNQLGDADVTYINSIAHELAKALGKLQRVTQRKTAPAQCTE